MGKGPSRVNDDYRRLDLGIVKTPSGHLEPQLASKLEALKSMAPDEHARMYRLLYPDMFVWTALLLAKTPPVRGSKSKIVRDSTRHSAKLISHDLKAFSSVIAHAAEQQNKQFFIDLGKYLSGELKAEMWDRLDVAVATIVLSKPSITAKQAVRELQTHGFLVSENDAESVFRMRKKRLNLGWLLREIARKSASLHDRRSRKM